MADTSRLDPTPSLVRGLSLVSAVAVVIATVIGTGVFLKARVMTCNVGSPTAVLAVWAIAGLLSLAGALTYAELGAMMPRAGGEYNFLRAAYGPRFGFLFGWTDMFVARTGSQASVAVAFTIFFNDLMGGSLSRPVLNVGPVEITTLQLLAVALIAIVAFVNTASVQATGRIATVLTSVKVILVATVGIGAFVLFDGSTGLWSTSGAAGACEGVSEAARGGVAGFGAAMLGALWGYDGWNNLTLVAGEVRDPKRNIPRALLIGVTIIIVLYLLANAAYFWVLSPVEVASVPAASSVAKEAAIRFLGPAFAGVMTAGLMMSALGTLHSSQLAGSRVPYALASDGLMPRAIGVLSRRRVPARAIALQAVWASVLALSGTFDTLTDYVIFGSWIFYGLTISAVFVLRRRMPEAERPYRTWGYPVVPVLFLLVTGFLLINTLMTTPGRALTGLGLIALGLPVYAYFHRRDENATSDTEAATTVR